MHHLVSYATIVNSGLSPVKKKSANFRGHFESAASGEISMLEAGGSVRIEIGRLYSAARKESPV
jgi:hypothetical protein